MVGFVVLFGKLLARHAVAIQWIAKATGEGMGFWSPSTPLETLIVAFQSLTGSAGFQ